MAGKAILTCRANSHPFKERILILDQPIKIGRSVARSRVASTNAIFDCKVLSRNHAILWFNNGKFYLQDTKSSNGTFVNQERLSKSGEESPPREVFSGDIVQFGVDVLENSRKVNHGCIIADLKLYLPDGKEAKAGDSSSNSSCSTVQDDTVSEPPSEQLYGVRRLVMDALQREHILEKQLDTLQAVLKHIGDEVKVGWKSLIAEDRLLTRVDALEDQLSSKNLKDQEELREEITKLHVEKNNYELTAKERMKKAIEEKMKLEQQLHETKRALGIIEAQYKAVTVDMEKSHEQIQDLTQKLNEQEMKNEEASAKIREMENEYKEEIQRLETRNQELDDMLRKNFTGDIDSHQLTESRIPTLNNAVDSFLKSIKKEENESDESNDDFDNCKNKMLKGIKNKEASDLLSAQLGLLEPDSMTKLKHIEYLKDMSELHLMSKQDFEIQCNELDAKIECLENELREATASRMTNNIPHENGQNDSNWDASQSDAKELEIEQLKDQREEIELKMKKSEKSWNRTKEDLESLQEDFERLNSNITVSPAQLAERNSKRIDDVSEPLSNEVEMTNSTHPGGVENNKVHEDENQILRRLLIEAQQSDKQSRNEAAQWKDRFNAVTRQLELKNASDDNKLLDELQEVKRKCSNLTNASNLMESEIKSLKDECSRLEGDKKELQESCSSLLSATREFQLELSQAEHKFLDLTEKYVSCLEEKNDLAVAVDSLKLDHQTRPPLPCYKFFFVPLIMLIIAAIIAFYPSLSAYWGTADQPAEKEK